LATYERWNERGTSDHSTILKPAFERSASRVDGVK
jgi:hypothetical protein